MSVTTAIRDLIAKGFTVEQALEAAEAFEAAMTPQRTARQDRNARYYQNKKATKASEKRLKASEPSYSDESVLNQTPSRGPTHVEDNLQTKNITGQEEKKEPSPPARSARGSRIPDDFKPDIEAAVSEGLPRHEAERQALSFCDFWRAKPGKDAMKLDWPATWRTWFRRRLDEKPNARAGPSRRRNFADVAADRWSGGNGSEGVFGGDGNVEFLPPRKQQSGPDDEHLRGGLARRFIAGNH